MKLSVKLSALMLVVALVFSGCNKKQSNKTLSNESSSSGSFSTVSEDEAFSDSSILQSTPEASDMITISNSSSDNYSSGSIVSPSSGSNPQKEPEEGSGEDVIIDNALFKIKDIYGSYSINVLGDSISHGANCPNIPRDSVMGLFKQSVNAKWKGNNYGFTSLLDTIGNNSGEYKEIHFISQTGNWQIKKDEFGGSYLGAYALKSTDKDDKMFVTLKKPYKYFSVFYEALPNGGTFDLLVDGTPVKSISTASNERNGAARSELIPTNSTKKVKIEIVNSNGKPVTITGMGYYNTKTGVVVNNYSKSGLKLLQMDDEIIKKACKASVVVFSLGHNDMFEENGNAKFTQKINLLINEIKNNKSTLIVNDYTWNDPKGTHIRKELKRLASETGAKFNDFTTSMKDQIQDGSHPYPSGHMILARKLCENLGIELVRNY